MLAGGERLADERMRGLDAAHALDDELDGAVGEDVAVIGGHPRVCQAVGKLEDALHTDAGRLGCDDLADTLAHGTVSQNRDVHANPIFQVCIFIGPNIKVLPVWRIRYRQRQAASHKDVMTPWKHFFTARVHALNL